MGSSAHAERPARYEDLLELPDHVVGEILGGDLFTSPRPAGPHAVASSALGGSLTPPFQFGDGGPGGWWILDEPELHLGEDVLVPDVAGWRRERMPTVPEDPHIVTPPDWVCEVLSPATARLDRTRKMPVYARAHILHLWLIDPATRLLEVYRLDGERWTLLDAHGDDAIVRAPPFEALELDLLRLWGDQRR